MTENIVPKTFLISYINSDLIIEIDSQKLIQKNSFSLQWHPYYPIYIFKDGFDWILSNNIRFLKNQIRNTTINETALLEFIYFNTPLEKNTIYNEIISKIGVEYININIPNKSFDFYNYNYHFKNSLLDDFDQNCQSCYSLFQNKNIASFLSGGGESRINAAFLESKGSNATYFTWGHPKDIEFQIASKIIEKLDNQKLINLRIAPPSRAEYFEYASETGFLSNLQYTYRIKIIKKIINFDVFDSLWTGWGDINGYPSLNYESEMFTNSIIGLINGELKKPIGFSTDWLKSINIEDTQIGRLLSKQKQEKDIFQIKRELLAPRIFGTVIGYENNFISICAPWFYPNIYQKIKYEENSNKKLVVSKLTRTKWKGNLYFQLVNKYFSKLNYLKNSKGYYPILLNKQFGNLGLALSFLLKTQVKTKLHQYDKTESNEFIKRELESIIFLNDNRFDNDYIKSLLYKTNNLSGTEIFNSFKIIQSNWAINSIK